MWGVVHGHARGPGQVGFVEIKIWGLSLVSLKGLNRVVNVIEFGFEMMALAVVLRMPGARGHGWMLENT